MPIFPNFTDPQFVDANGVGGLNAAVGTVSGSLTVIGREAFIVPGLLQPEPISISTSLMVATVTIPAPAGIVNASGVVTLAHGTQTGLDTQTYTVNFAPIVPASGSVTAFLVASATQIQQNPFPIPGPPPGHPSFNPNFVPTIGYAQNVDTIALSATTTPPDNLATFELGRTVLTHGQTSLLSFNVFAQERASVPLNRQQLIVTTSSVLTAGLLQYLISCGTAAITTTLPTTSASNGCLAIFVNNSVGNWTIAGNGADTITGASAAPTSTTIVHSGGALALWSNGPGATWNQIAANQAQNLANPNTWTGGNTFSAGGGWSTFNWGKQLLVTTPFGSSNPAIGITDVNQTNLWGFSNSGHSLDFAAMPAYSNSSTPPNIIFSLSTSGVIASQPITVTDPNAQGGVIVNGTVAGAAIKLSGNGGTTPNKWLRATNGEFGVVNNAYTAEIFTLSDAGDVTNIRNLTANAGIAASGTVQGAFVNSTGNMNAVGTYTGGAVSVNGTITGGTVISAGNVTANRDVTAAGNIAANGDITASVNMAANGSITAIGSLTGLTVASANGNVTAGNGRLRATFGAFGSGDVSAAALLGDFTFSAGDPGYRRGPDGFIIQWGFASIFDPSNVFFPLTFPNACLRVFVCEGAGNPANWPLFPNLYAAGNSTTTLVQLWVAAWNGSNWVSPATPVTASWIAVGF